MTPEIVGSEGPDQVELYLERASFFQAAEFEHYTLRGSRLLVECGTVRNTRQSVRARWLLRLESEDLTTIQEQSSDVSEYIAQNSPSLDEAGDGEGIFDHGFFQLILSSTEREIRLKTALDSVASPTAPAERRLQHLAELLRNSAKKTITQTNPNDAVLCGNQQFYGLN